MVGLVATLVMFAVLASCSAEIDDAADGYECGSLTFTRAQLDDAPLADRLRPEDRAAFEGDGHEIPQIDLDDGWRTVEQTRGTIGLIRPLDEPQEIGPGDVRTHEHVRVRRSRESANVPDGDWVMDSAGVCTPRLNLGRLAQADLTLAERLDPAATEVRLEVYERACASGEDARGRVRVVEQEVTEDEVRLVIGVRPRDGDATCPENPPTPLTIALDEPLGDRTVVDASTLPPQPLPLSPGPSDARNTPADR